VVWKRGSFLYTGFLLFSWAGSLVAQDGAVSGLPFGVGEELVYQVRSNRFGKIGDGTMRVEGPDLVRGHAAYLLHFEVDGRVGPFKIADLTRSWLDPARFAALRYEKTERHPLSKRREEVELFPSELRWSDRDGEGGELVSDDPLDELSFIYLLRTLDFGDSDELSISRHYQAERNPVVVRLVGREEVSLPTGLLSTLVIEMEVRDGKRFGGSGLIKLHLTDDLQRYPVRIETTMPVVGTLVLDLVSLTPGHIEEGVVSR